jgi:hypothetical protein
VREPGEARPGLDELDPAAREALLAVLVTDRAAEDPVVELLGSNIGYHLLLRSCITMSLTAIDLAVERAYRSAGRPRRRRLDVVPGPLPEWIGELAHADMAGVFQRLPYALAWLAEHHRVIPAAAYQILRDAGLLHRKNGRTVWRYYDLRRRTPYGRLGENLVF